ncbi:MAG: zinc-dependent metalloprotease, partial [Planctomycetota bacterium]
RDQEKVSATGITASVMDYNPVNLAPEGVKQTDYYSTTIGPYDYWAIEYGYTPLKDEKKGLAEIASRSGEPELAFGTDEDTRGIDPDPHSRRFDLTSDLIGYAEQQAQIVAEAMPKILDEIVDEGDGYEQARRAFGVLLQTHGVAMFNAARYVGGVYVSRSHRGDANAAEPMDVVDVERQREALALVAAQVFSDQPFDVPASLYNKLAPSRWRHWGVDYVDRIDYPVHRVIRMWQDRVLDQLVGSLTLTRVHDNELKVPKEEEALTVADLIGTLTDAVFVEVREFDAAGGAEYTNRKPLVSSLRRNLQRSYLARLGRLALGRGGGPADCQTLAYAELSDLKAEIDAVLGTDIELDRYSAAHLREASDRIEKTLTTDRLFERASGGGLLQWLMMGAEPEPGLGEVRSAG